MAIWTFKNKKKHGKWVRYNKDNVLEYDEEFVEGKKISKDIEQKLQPENAMSHFLQIALEARQKVRHLTHSRLSQC